MLQVFTCLALFNNLISPLNSFPWVINGLIDVSYACYVIFEVLDILNSVLVDIGAAFSLFFNPGLYIN